MRWYIVTETEIRELIGELIVAGFTGQDVTDHAKRLIVKHRVKNIILFGRNVDTSEQLTGLNQSLQKLAHEAGHELPIIICTDQENGVVRRLPLEVPGLPGNMAIGATGNEQHAYSVGEMTARQLVRLGVNLNLAPSIDVNNNPHNPVIGVRSYGEDADKVGLFGREMIRGLQAGGVMACAKHFPGHGDTAVDSHLALPRVPHSLERLRQVELKPFDEAIATGVDVIMTAHIVFPAIEPREIPATLSHGVLTGLLRQQLGFEGIIMTDCLEMDAISQTIGVEEGAVEALCAGADLLLISHRWERQEAAIEELVRAVKDGRVPEDRLWDAANRVKNLRKKLPVCGPPTDDASEHTSVKWDNVTDEAIELQRTVSSFAVTIVRNDEERLPLRLDSIKSLSVLQSDASFNANIADNVDSSDLLMDALLDTLPGRTIQRYAIGGESGLPDKQLLRDSSLVLVALGSDVSEMLVQYLRQLSDDGVPVVVMALQSPYVLPLVSVKTAVAIYEYTPWMVRAGVNALFGVGGTGHLPLSLA